MPSRQEFSTGRFEGAPSADIGWHFGESVAGNRNNVKCKLCDKKGGGSNARGGISGSGTSRVRLSESEDHAFQLRSEDINLVRSRSTKQPKITGGLMKTLRKKLGEAVSKLIIYERLPMNLASSPWLHNLINSAAEIGTGVKFPTPYEISDLYLESEFQSMKEWIDRMKMIWQEKGVTIMCDGWTNSINHMHIMNFLVYCSRGTIFLKSIDASDVSSRNTDYYFKLLDKVVEEIGEEYVVQVVTDNEGALKAADKKLMEKRKHIYWTPCAAHCIDLCLEDIGKKSNVKNVLENARLVTSFIYNHIWTVNLMKEFIGGREIIRPAITRFATQFIQLQSIVKQKQALKEMFNSEKFKKSKFGKLKSGAAYDAKKIVLSNDFWNKANDIIKVFEPIVKVLKLVDDDEKPAMGFIYEAVDRAKQSIQQNCRYHIQYNDIVDKRWRFLHNDLHSAAEWWLVYGSDTPELQRIAIKEEDPLSPWIEERENTLLDGVQNGE
ncbi:uncharacterized protein G2W53_040096 [Senna tora]|uniref:DUF659 domain-containing protein n=1 Tax=Senna tora TaxID=362788 RepID=A0A834W3E7_9FABA|nr:uncharacterized protein G2W53_040096 [Senna tora]